MNAALTEHLIDVRPMPPRERHPKIFGTWADLASGESILLVNDHDPVPLYAKLGHQGFTHQAEQLSDGTWRVEFRKAG
jgi:uncharacterized protein (DUF2249 family)